jgi:hypothetical protein
MNEPSTIPPIIPSSLHPGEVEPPLGAMPGDTEAIVGPVAAMEALLRQPRRLVYRLTQPNPIRILGSMMAVMLVCALIYGVVAGTYSGGEQLWAAPIKIAGGILASALICLPSLYIFACLGGARVRFVEAAGLLAGLTALMAVLLAGFAPVAWVFSQSTQSVSAMGTLHVVFALVAVVFGLRFLFAGFGHFAVTHRSGIQFWGLVFLMVMLQMTTSLRPIVGKSATFLPSEKKFFLAHWTDCIEAEARGKEAIKRPTE